MAHDCQISHRMKAAQETMFRVACREASLKAISLDSGIPYSTLRSYAGHNGDTAEMPLSALYKLVGVIADELLSLLLPDGRQIVRAPDDLDHDALCELAESYVREKTAAHRKDSPGGVAIVDCERSRLNAKAVALKVAA